MNSLQLKIIAIITMLIDHIGLFFYPEIQIFRIIGRISFPIFAFLLINTWLYTNNLDKKINKLWLTAIITQIIINITKIEISNILISMWLALNILKNIKNENKLMKNIYIISTILCSIISNNFTYIYEVLFIILYPYIFIPFKNINSKKYIIILLILIIITTLSFNINIIYKLLYIIFTTIGIILSIKSYNSHYGNKKIHKILWYTYPVHFIILHIIRTLI